MPLEGLLTLADNLWVIEIPLSVAWRHGLLGCGGLLLLVVAHRRLLGEDLFCFSLFTGSLLLLLFLLELLNDTVNDFQTLFLGHLGQPLQRVLQLHAAGMGHQFVEHFRTVGQLLVVLAVLVEQSDGFAVAALGVGKFLALPVQVTQCQQQHTLFDTATSRLLVALFVSLDGLYGIAFSQPDVADGIVYLVLVIFVVVRCRHAFQLAHHLLGILAATGHYFGLGNAGIELQLVGRTEPDHPFEGIESLILMTQQCLDLSQQEPLPGFLLATLLVFDDLAQVGDGLLVLLRVDIVIGIGVVPVGYGTVVHCVTLLLRHQVFGFIQPVELRIALGLPCTGNAPDGRLPLIQTCHIREGGGSLFELALLKL